MSFYDRVNSQATDYQDLPPMNDAFRRTMTNPYMKTYTIPAKEYVFITKENRNKFFSKKCPICGKQIFGRPSEYPYYKRDGNQVAFVCSACDKLKCVKGAEKQEKENNKES